MSQMSSVMAKHSKSQVDRMDQDYLGSVDIMEMQSIEYQKEIMDLKMGNDDEKQRLGLIQVFVPAAKNGLLARRCCAVVAVAPSSSSS